MPLIALWLYEPEQAAIGADRESMIKAGLLIPSIRRLLVQLPLRTLALAYAIILIVQVGGFLVPLELPFYLRTTLQANPTMIGVTLATYALFAAAVSTQYARIRRRFGVIDVIVLMFAALGTGLVIVSVSEAYWGIFVGLAIGSVGLGVMVPNMNAWIAAEVPATVRGRAFGGLTSFLFLGQFLTPFVSEPVSDMIGLDATFAVVGVVLLGLAGMVGGFCVWRSTRLSQPLADSEETEAD